MIVALVIVLQFWNNQDTNYILCIKHCLPRTAKQPNSPTNKHTHRERERETHTLISHINQLHSWMEWKASIAYGATPNGTNNSNNNNNTTIIIIHLNNQLWLQHMRMYFATRAFNAQTWVTSVVFELHFEFAELPFVLCTIFFLYFLSCTYQMRFIWMYDIFVSALCLCVWHHKVGNNWMWTGYAYVI